MKIPSMFAAVAAISLAAAPAVSAAEADYASAPVTGSSELGGESSDGVIFAVLATVILGAFIYFTVDDDDDDDVLSR
ncbi:hypothetical protein HME9302_02146 [Alteripontixanthobacter maritimus]|uniref:Ferrochelatase n=1 Tax=Alteripontixanthobacter maritimus TaxID=2161824 RepID=A0A369QDD6_9SPHN|nr:hypothetical protein [Alteripontixanthobacter maritimus]RDC60929.1 hypothetical protein HME9302_02146 [Alteripontixanthobacter maritimus]